MLKIRHLIQVLFAGCLILLATNTQAQDPVLFTVNGSPVEVSEFNYIYAKTNGEKADYSRSSLEEYLDLYVKFKLKVQKAREMQLDTIPALVKELEGYRRQLANSYLVDKEVTENLIKDVYDRSKKDIDISHILVQLDPATTGKDTIAPYARIMEVKKKLDNGASFEQVATTLSDDKGTKENGGRIGFLTAMLPDGFYALEKKMYELKPGQYGGPIRTRLGYHMIKVNSEREARGEIEAAHILLRKNKEGDNTQVKKLIDSLYQALQNGAAFDQLAKDFSQDKTSASKRGYIGFFGINRYENAFEDAAFALEKDGSYTAPVETTIGWHIIQRVSKSDNSDYELARRRLKNLILKDERHILAKNVMVRRIQDDNNFAENTKVRDAFMDSLDTEFFSHRWAAPKLDGTQALFTLGKDFKVTLNDYMEYCRRAARKRLRTNNNADPKAVAHEIYQEFVADNCLKFEESKLEEKYPDFKSLMREYEEGILLFEATKMLVWDMASQDSAGLAGFFSTVSHKYKWKERAAVTTYVVSPEGADKIASIQKLARKKKAQTVLDQFNKEDKELISAREEIFERGRNSSLEEIKWKSGAISESKNDRKGNTIFYRINEVIPPASKTLDEARGYVVADYQDHLERAWVKKLKEQYSVSIDKEVFETLVKK